MIFATGGVAVGDISIRSKPASFAAAWAAARLNTPRFDPSAPMTRSSGARIWALMRMRGVLTANYLATVACPGFKRQIFPTGA